MKRAITFCALVLGVPTVTYTAIESFMLGRFSVHAANGLECTMEREDVPAPPQPGQSHHRTEPIRTSDIRHIEFLPENKFRLVDERARNDVLANDYIGMMTTTDTTYTFGVPRDREKFEEQIPGSSSALVIELERLGSQMARDFSGLVVDRVTTKLFEHYIEGPALPNEITITGWCTPSYVTPRPVPKKL